MEYSDKVAVVNRYVEAFDKADMEIIREIYTEDAVVEDPVGSEPHVGIEAICTFYEVGLGAGAKLVLTGPVRGAGNAAAFPFQVQMGGMNIDIIDVFEFNDQGKITSMKAYWGPENM